MSNVTLKDVFEVTNRIEDKLDKLESRISFLELWRSNVQGQLAIFIGIITITINLFWNTIKDRLRI